MTLETFSISELDTTERIVLMRYGAINGAYTFKQRLDSSN